MVAEGSPSGTARSSFTILGRVSCVAIRGLFSNSVKRKLEEDLKNLQHRNRSVHEYIREFTRLLNCIPFAARDEAHQIYMFEKGLHKDLYQFVHSQRLQTLEAVMEHALWMEREATVLKEWDKALGATSGEKCPMPFDGGQTSHQRPLRPSRFPPRGRRFQRRSGSGRSRQQRLPQQQQYQR